MKTIASYLALAILICAFIFGAYWVAKNGSYWLWYGDMVKDTVREMVKQESLRHR